MTQQQTSARDPVSQGLLSALLEDEAALARAHQKMVEAQTQYTIASRRYAAMREAVRERLGTSPYSKNVAWPGTSPAIKVLARGWFQFRYINMKVGDAVTEVLQESEGPLTLDEIAEALSAGGLYTRDTRAVNAALINTKGIKKRDDGRYTYNKEVAEAFDAIFPVFGRLGQ